MNPDFNVVREFEKQVAAFFGAPYGVAVDSCTHGLELCLRYTAADFIEVPKRTYLSVPMLAHKLNIPLMWSDAEWQDYYEVAPRVFDAAVLWRRNSYMPKTFMCISFQYQKHLKLGRAGIILLDDEQSAINLKKLSYDGRIPGIPWRDQDIKSLGFHYYLQPELAELGLQKLPTAIASKPRQWLISDWPILTEMSIFKENK